MAFNKWGMIGNDQKCSCFFQNVGCNITKLAKRTINIICFSIQGGAAPVLHADCSLFRTWDNDDLSIAQARWIWQASGFSILQFFIPRDGNPPRPLSAPGLRLASQYRPHQQRGALSRPLQWYGAHCMQPMPGRHAEWGIHLLQYHSQ